MNVHLWKIPQDYPDKFIGQYDVVNSPDSYLFDKGESLSSEKVNKPVIIKFQVSMHDLQLYDCLNNTALIPVVNKRVINLLYGSSSKDVQFFEAILKCDDGELENYKILNVTHLVEGIDHGQSIYKKMKLVNRILSIKKLIYKPECMKEHALARDVDYKRNILVSNDIYSIFIKEKITGVWLPTPNEYYELVHNQP